MRYKYRTNTIFIIVQFILVMVFSSCNNENDLGPQNEEFVGYYLVRDLNQVSQLAKEDSVLLSVIRNTSYSMIFFEGAGSSKDVDFCNHSGTILDFGTGKASFDPTGFNYDNCDSLRVPRGTFSADFINHGDTILLERSVKGISGTTSYDSLFQLKLLK